MVVNNTELEKSLVDQAVAWLQERLPSGWSVERANAAGPGNLESADSTLSLKAPSATYTTMAVEARRSLTPRNVTTLLTNFGRVLHSMAGNVPLLVVAPWLSQRTQELLAEEQINYIDLTGNALVRTDNPALYIQTVGSTRDPSPKDPGQVQLRGPKAARLTRLLLDVRPPYGVRELAEAADLTAGYVSRLLNALYRESLIERSPRGPVESVDIPGVVRRWATSYDVFKSNTTRTFIAPAGTDALLARLATDPGKGTRIAITGSFAAARIAPVTAPAMLLAYYDSPTMLAGELQLLPAEEGANVAFLEPFDRVVWLRTPIEDGLRYAAPSQVAVDCLTGNGRMPAEGEALLDWMEKNESSWRLESLEQLRFAAAP